MRDSILNSGYVQFRVKTGEVDTNLASLRQGLAAISPPANALFVLPEMWSCGFDYPRMAEHAERTPELLLELTAIAREMGICLVGSMPEAEDDRIYNTLYLVGPEGVAGSHRKSRLFGLMGEDRFFTPGPPPDPWETPLGLVAPLICFELRFPELARAPVAEGAEIIVVAAQWPKVRIGQWRLLLKARAVENQAFVIAANGCGQGDDEPGGNSLVIGPDGTILAEAENSPAGAVAALDRERLAAVRQRFSTVARPGPSPIEKKIVAAGNIKEALAPYRRGGGKVVFTNGCFDILHPGHVTYLEEARGMGDCLVLGLNSDASVRRLKGASRPVNDQASRARVLAGLACVDFVVLFEEDTPLELIKGVGPDILVKGGDWPVEKIVGAAEVQAAGGRVFSIPLVGDHSTTGIIKEIKGRDEG